MEEECTSLGSLTPDFPSSPSGYVAGHLFDLLASYSLLQQFACASCYTPLLRRREKCSSVESSRPITQDNNTSQSCIQTVKLNLDFVIYR